MRKEIILVSVMLAGCAQAQIPTGTTTPASSISPPPQYITNSQGQTTGRIDHQGWITDTRGQTTGRIDSQGWITNTRGQTVGRIEGTRR